eukprot:357916-Chlamydomonas_euryale.AAC.5
MHFHAPSKLLAHFAATRRCQPGLLSAQDGHHLTCTNMRRAEIPKCLWHSVARCNAIAADVMMGEAARPHEKTAATAPAAIAHAEGTAATAPAAVAQGQLGLRLTLSSNLPCVTTSSPFTPMGWCSCHSGEQQRLVDPSRRASSNDACATCNSD